MQGYGLLCGQRSKMQQGTQLWMVRQDWRSWLWKSGNCQRISDRRPHYGYRLFNLPNHLPDLPSKKEEAAETSPSLPTSPPSTALWAEAKESPRHPPDIHVRRECLTSGGIRQLCPLRSKCCSMAVGLRRTVTTDNSRWQRKTKYATSSFDRSGRVFEQRFSLQKLQRQNSDLKTRCYKAEQEHNC